MGFGKSKKSEVVEPIGHQNYGYIDDEVKFPNLNGDKKGGEKEGEDGKEDQKESEDEEKDKSSFFALVSFFFKKFSKIHIF